MGLYQTSDRQRFLSAKEEKQAFPAFRRDYARVIHSASFRRLQGKTQIFPYLESDFFRNRLTHSLEVAQVAKAIALRINENHDIHLDYDLVETAALCHDIGHPPFGHNGEQALWRKMSPYGGFEGNAQTLRLLTRTEKRAYAGQHPIEQGQDTRCGLNLTYRALAAVLKYDQPIAVDSHQPDRIVKGYYVSETKQVEAIKSHVLNGYSPAAYANKPFYTIECSIMDLADDIAYSTYDIEDALKGGFLTPMSMISADDALLKQVKNQAEKKGFDISLDEIRQIIRTIFSDMIDLNSTPDHIYQQSKALAGSSYWRTQLTSKLVNDCIQSVTLQFDRACPVLSTVCLTQAMQKQVEVLKLLVYFAVINAPKMNIVRYRGREILSTLFDILIESTPETNFLPEDIGQVFYAYQPEDQQQRARVICDFIASMTDRYAIELYQRFKSDTPQSIFKPV